MTYSYFIWYGLGRLFIEGLNNAISSIIHSIFISLESNMIISYLTDKVNYKKRDLPSIFLDIVPVFAINSTFFTLLSLAVPFVTTFRKYLRIF